MVVQVKIQLLSIMIGDADAMIANLYVEIELYGVIEIVLLEAVM